MYKIIERYQRHGVLCATDALYMNVGVHYNPGKTHGDSLLKAQLKVSQPAAAKPKRRRCQCGAALSHVSYRLCTVGVCHGPARAAFARDPELPAVADLCETSMAIPLNGVSLDVRRV